MSANPNNANPDVAIDAIGDEDLGSQTPTLMERWETKHSLVVIGAIVLIYFAYKKLKK